MNTHQYFTITYDISKLSDDEQKQLFANAQSLFQSGKAISAGWVDKAGDFHSNIDDGDVAHWMLLPQSPKKLIDD